MKNWSLFFVLSLSLVGCGGSGTTFETRPVSGTLTWDDDSPISGARINFLPTSGPSSWATTDDDGKFTLALPTGGKGAVVGKHKVTVSKPGASEKVDFNSPEGLRKMAEMRNSPQKGKTSMPENMGKQDSVIPAKYSKTGETPLEYEVTADGSHTGIPFVVSRQ